MPASTCPTRPATRTMKNSSRLLAEIDRKRSRSSSGWPRLSASSSTRRLNSSHDSSRLMNRSGEVIRSGRAHWRRRALGVFIVFDLLAPLAAGDLPTAGAGELGRAARRALAPPSFDPPCEICVTKPLPRQPAALRRAARRAGAARARRAGAHARERRRHLGRARADRAGAPRRERAPRGARRVVRQHRHARLRDDRPGVEFRHDEMDGAAVLRETGGERALMGVQCPVTRAAARDGC